MLLTWTLPAALIPALIGATIAVLTRSTTIAMSVGLGWFILAEALIGAFWDGLSRWRPAGVSNAIAAGGTGGATMMDGAAPGISHASIGKGRYVLLPATPPPAPPRLT